MNNQTYSYMGRDCWIYSLFLIENKEHEKINSKRRD